MEFSILTAFTIGLLGLTHCLGMCGGIVGTLDAGIGRRAGHFGGRFPFHLAYNAGRIASYIIAGLLAGLLGSLAATASFGNTVPAGRMVAGVVMIALGLYLAGWWQAITVLEHAGLRIWRRVEPVGRNFLPVNSPVQAFGLGLIWGWLPCGLVYSALALAMASASALGGSLIMAAFGLGTLPALLSFGVFSGVVSKWVRHPLLRQAAGMAIVLFGVYSCVLALQGHSHGGH
ncbi:MAG: sulfite exporter TauE/SafE family protein [Rhodobacteraceae bacterium]|nr:sulfite exporter TauE/SafE family protein [Paracoccaceae bacterium]